MGRAIGAKLLPAVVGLALATGAVSGRPDDPPKAPAELQGCWKLVSFETDGETQNPVGGGEPRWVIKGDTVYYGGEAVVRLVADPATSPKIVDLRFRDPDRVYEAVYMVEKDTLKVCLNARADAKNRPGEFATKDQADWRLLTFEREKAAPANPTEGLTGFAGVQIRNDPDRKAVVIAAPLKGSPAEKAGLKKGDVILKVGATAVTKLEPTIQLVRQARPGTKLEFQVNRDGRELAVTVPVGVFPLPYTVLLN